jgi:signal transduction histidine kinase
METMNEIILPNTLTTEERLSLTRLLGHDTFSLLNSAFVEIALSTRKNLPVEKETVHYLELVHAVGRTISGLAETENLILGGTGVKPYDSETLEWMGDCLNIVNEGLLEKNISKNINFEGDKNILLVVLNNLIKNARACSKKLPVTLSVERTDFPLSANYIPEGARNYSEFIALRISNSGKSFPSEKEKSYDSYFTEKHKRGNRGFGLYFTGLAAKVLQAPVEIKSIEGKSTVSFYHPNYRSKAQ